MKGWPVQDAKARFSQFLQASLTQGPQLVTMRGADAAVLVSVQQWRSLTARARTGLKEVLLARDARGDLSVPARGTRRRRAPRKID